MSNFKFINLKIIKIIGLITIIFLSSMLFCFNWQTVMTKSNNGTTNNLSGFHITVTENNKNQVKDYKNWNQINDHYQQSVETDPKKNLIKATFDSWEEITDNKPNNSISQQVNESFQSQLSDENKQYFDETIVGRSIANNSFNTNITSFGNVYVNYHDNSPLQINNGLFATINSESDLKGYFPIPYTLVPGEKFLEQPLKDRVKIIPLGSDPVNINDQRSVVILARKGDNEELKVTGNTVINVIKSGGISYALINHNPSDGFSDTKFSVNVLNSPDPDPYHKDVTIKDNVSDIWFTNPPDNIQDKATVIDHDYLIQKLDRNTDNLLVMNKGQKKVKVNFENNQEKWAYWKVNPQTLTKEKTKYPVIDADLTLNLDVDDNYQIYYIALDNEEKEQNSAQYVVLTKDGTSTPNFANCFNLFDDSKVKDELKGFKQYLTSTSNINVNDLKANQGELISWFCAYKSDLQNHYYVNYLEGNNNAPWDMNVKLTITTLVDHWNVVIIAGIVIVFLIISPIAVLIIRKRKFLK